MGNRNEKENDLLVRGAIMNSFNLEKLCYKEVSLKEVAKTMVEGMSPDPNIDKPIVKEKNDAQGCPIEGHGGHWEGERGNSRWYPDKDVEPGDRHGTNPEHKTWREILDEYGIDSIPFKDGEPDFSEVAKDTVEIEDFSTDRDSNFDQADEKIAEKWGCTPEEVAKWRKDNNYTWHECKDCKTMQLVPTEIHGNISHSGGISEMKNSEAV